MRVFKTKIFQKWAKKNKISDTQLLKAAIEVSDGMYEASLGGNIFKKRVATKGRGKSGSSRTIIAFKIRGHGFFLFGFEKNERSTLSVNEEKALKLIAKSVQNKKDSELEALIIQGVLFEVCDE